MFALIKLSIVINKRQVLLIIVITTEIVLLVILLNVYTKPTYTFLVWCSINYYINKLI